MPAGNCQRCGAAEVRCKGLCSRCYFARRYERPEPLLTRDQALAEPLLTGDQARTLERAWGARQLVAALMAESPEQGRHETASWRAAAACRTRRDLPWEGERPTPEMRAICASCPVGDACLAEAVADRSVGGVWAGTTRAERRRLRPR